MARAIMLRNRPHRTRQDRFVGDDEGVEYYPKYLELESFK